MRNALKCKPVAAPPLWELEFQLWDAFSGKKLILGREFENLSPAEQDQALHHNAEIFTEVAIKLGFAGISLPSTYWEYAPGELAYFVLPTDEAVEKQIQYTREILPQEMVIVGHSTATLGIPPSDQYMEFSYLLFDDPDEIQRRAEAIYERGVGKMKRQRAAGAEAFLTCNDIGDNHGVYFNDEQYEEFILPYLNKWAEETHREGGFALMHSDGNLNRVLHYIADSAVDGLQSIDPIAGMNMVEAKNIVGNKLCLCGNVDCGMMLLGTPEDATAATVKLLDDCKDFQGIILGMSNASQRETKKDNYMAMVEARRNYYHLG